MNKLQKFNELVAYAKEQGYEYHVHVLVRADNIAWTSHYPTIFHRAFLTAVVGEKRAYATGLEVFNRAFNQQDAIGYLYDQWLAYKGVRNGEN